jgi:Xaa-Pro dipeptidase
VTRRGLWDDIPGAYNHGVYAYAVGMGYQPSWCEQAVYIAEGQERVLEPGMTFHVPMCIWYPAELGVGFSETIAITEDGCELLTPGADRHLVIR